MNNSSNLTIVATETSNDLSIVFIAEENDFYDEKDVSPTDFFTVGVSDEWTNSVGLISTVFSKKCNNSSDYDNRTTSATIITIKYYDCNDNPVVIVLLSHVIFLILFIFIP